MVTMSKLYQWPLNRTRCSETLLHPGQPCLTFLISNYFSCISSGAIYFSPILITSLILKYKNMNRQKAVQRIIYYLKTIFWFGMMGGSIISYICFFRFCLGKYTKYTIVFLPGYFGAQLCWFIPQRNIELYTIATSQAVLETMLRLHTNPISNLLLNSKVTQTILFMLCSAIILHYKRNDQYKGFWFIQPLHRNVIINEDNKQDADMRENIADLTKYECNNVKEQMNKCSHTGMTCRHFIWNGIKKYITFTIPLDIFNTIMKAKVPKETHGIMQLVMYKLKRLRFKMTLFFLSYVGIYRLASCCINRYFNIESDVRKHFICALLGGSSFMLLRKVSFLTMAMVIVVQILWQEICATESHSINTSSKRLLSILDVLKHIPFSKIIIPINSAFCAHWFMYNHKQTSSLGLGFVNAATNSNAQRLYNAVTALNFEDILRCANAEKYRHIFQ